MHIQGSSQPGVNLVQSLAVIICMGHAIRLSFLRSTRNSRLDTFVLTLPILVGTRNLTAGRHEIYLLHTFEGLVAKGGGSQICICADDHDSDQYSSRTKLLTVVWASAEPQKEGRQDAKRGYCLENLYLIL